MKKFIALLLPIIIIISLCSCDISQFFNKDNDDTSNDGYKLTVIDFWGYLVEPLDEYYEAGEVVEVHLEFLSGPSVGIELNGEYIGETPDTELRDGHNIITFTMPARDSVLYTTQNGNIGFPSKLSGAGWTSEFDEGALNADKLSNKDKKHFPIYKFDTLEELQQFNSDFGCRIDYFWDEVPSLNNTTKDYDTAFFERYTLMLVYVDANSGSYRYGCKGVTIDDGYFCIHIEQTNDPDVCTDDMAGWFVTVAVPDSMISNISEFDADYVSNKR